MTDKRREDLKTPDPFAILDVPEDADDETIKRRYLALVRQHPPEREPERFGEIRAAFEAVESKRDRLRARLLTIHDAALLRLKRDLQDAVDSEDYERSARLRDQIRTFERQSH